MEPGRAPRVPEVPQISGRHGCALPGGRGGGGQPWEADARRLRTLKTKLSVTRTGAQPRTLISECKETPKSKNEKGKWVGFTFSALWRSVHMATHGRWRPDFRLAGPGQGRAGLPDTPGLSGATTQQAKRAGRRDAEQGRGPPWDRARDRARLRHSASAGTASSPEVCPTQPPPPPRPTQPPMCSGPRLWNLPGFLFPTHS